MINIVFFLVTVVVYFGVWSAIKRPANLKESVLRLALLTFLAIPFNINGNVFTVIGNAKAEKDIYALAALYQQAGGNAMNVIGVAYQQAGRDAMNVIGVAYQQAGRDAVNVIGVANQQAGGNASSLIGVVVYQEAGNSAETNIGVAIYQKVATKSRAFAVWSTLTKNSAE